MLNTLFSLYNERTMPEYLLEKIVITNFKCFEGEFELPINEGINVLVGDNDAGKSSIMEAIDLALTGFFHGRYLKRELSQYLFNNGAVKGYLAGIKNGEKPMLPAIYIDLYFKPHKDLAAFSGDCNARRENGCGVSYAIEFDDGYTQQYEALLKEGSLSTLPIEYYDVNWCTFAHEKITSRGIPIKCALIESMASRMQNGSDYYVSRIVREILDESDKVGVAQAHRKLRDLFQDESAIETVNKKLQSATGVSDKTVTLAVDLATKNAWETTLTTLIDDVPFHFVGRGEQSMVKTRLALSHKKSLEANVLLIEEPENHLTHTNLNALMKRISDENHLKQIFVTTHSSYVANKLNLKNLVLLNASDSKHSYCKMGELADEGNFFTKLPGYDTLRVALADKTILVEGDADELAVQKAYMQMYSGRLPIDDRIDVISVGTAFKRFLEIAKTLGKKVAVVTDSDGKPSLIDKKYSEYASEPCIKVFYDPNIDSGALIVKNKPYNYNTLEPKLLKVNGLDAFNKLLGTTHKSEDDMRKYMQGHKTDLALSIFSSKSSVVIPTYITDAISWIANDEPAAE